jgi:Kdo2-lipid IVA lauroyltransferase/acyltransferase
MKKNKDYPLIEDTRLLKLAYFHPKYFGTWAFIGFLYLACHLPFAAQWQVSRALAFLTYHLAKSRRRIAEVNIDICFPEKSAAERKQLVKETFHENMQGYIDSGTAWFFDNEKFRDCIRVVGMEHYTAAKANGQGVIMAGAHFSILDLAGFLTDLVTPYSVTYRPLDDKVMNAVMMKGRYKFVQAAYHKNNVAGFIDCLKRGETLWYAPDQDYGRKYSVFVPFFGRMAATISGLTFLSEQGNAVVVPYSYHREGKGQNYVLEFFPALPKTGSEEQDAINYNTWLESVLRTKPSQYLWLHKRFKTQVNPADPKPY